MGALLAITAGVAGLGLSTIGTLAGCDPGPCPPGSFLTAANLITARSAHTATQLADGRVLVAGGDAEGGPPNSLASAELYDPHADRWSPAASLHTARSNHTATPVGGFRVLVVGGIDSAYHSTPTSEMYDARANAWTSVASLSVRRYDHTATLLPNGNLLIAGGTQINTKLTSVETYNPSIDAWQPSAGLATGRSNHTATLLGDGKILVVGGFGASGVLGSAELYDSSTNAWSSAGSLATPRALHTATLLTDGRVLVAGGVDASNHPLAAAEVYDPKTNSWSKATSMSVAHAGATATLLDGGEVLLLGGRVSGTVATLRPGVVAATFAEVYDPKANRWLPDVYGGGEISMGPLPIADRVLHTATLLANGRVLVTGGTDGKTQHVLNGTGLYELNPITLPPVPAPTATATPSASAVASGGTWTPASHMSTGRYAHTATLLEDGRVLVTGGARSPSQELEGPPPSDVLSSAEIYDPSSNTWSVAASMSVPRYHHTATLLENGKVLIAGGSAPAGTGPTGSLASAELYDPATNTWSPAHPLAVARDEHIAVLLHDGTVLVAGGDGANGVLTSAERYDPNSDGWFSAGDMVAGRNNHTATLLASGQVLVAGGANGLSSAELYDPYANSWTLAAGMTIGRTLHTATELSTGKVLVAGGLSALGPLASTELYDPLANSWSASGTMSTARYGQTSTLLPGGQVMGICGGCGDCNGGEAPSVESYDPTTGTWTPVASSMGLSPDAHTATLLKNGKILVAGGQTGTAALSSVEFFTPPKLKPHAARATGLPLALRTGLLVGVPAMLVIVAIVAAATWAVRRRNHGGI